MQGSFFQTGKRTETGPSEDFDGFLCTVREVVSQELAVLVTQLCDSPRGHLGGQVTMLSIMGWEACA